MVVVPFAAFFFLLSLRDSDAHFQLVPVVVFWFPDASSQLYTNFVYYKI